jgi:hypothetical protein
MLPPYDTSRALCCGAILREDGKGYFRKECQTRDVFERELEDNIAARAASQ